jgi:perosamine synthetase
VHYVPIHFHPYFREALGVAPGDYPVAERVFEGLVSLPLHPGLSDDDVGRVAGSVLEVVEASRR